jgi:hypothetical protein
MQSLRNANILDINGIVDLDVNDSQISAALDNLNLGAKEVKAIAVVKRSRYINMYKLLRDHLSEETYLRIVKNQILVDIQAGDILYQIFTANILQRKEGDEAPFLEFIQRVCSEKCTPDGKTATIRAGCGGFGIRNFLTLFLSIEVSKAMLEFDKCVSAGDKNGADLAQKKIDAFSNQLDASNPILTSIAESMTAEADALEKANKARTDEEKNLALSEAENYRKEKELGQKKLMELSAEYKQIMEKLRTGGQ